MTLSSTSSVLNANAATSSVLQTGTSQLSQTDFLKLLAAQLQNQDPLNPVSQSDFTSQIEQLNQLSDIQQLNTSIQQLVQLQGLGQGASLIGKSVQYTPAGGTGTQTGVVSGVSVANNAVQLKVGTDSVPLSQVSGILGT